MDSYERQQVIKEMHEMLREQRERITTKEQAEEVLRDLGIWHLLVDKETGKSGQTDELDSAGK
ncbi:MAG TPA: hypothetical protein VNS58_22405 [Puia sp.]|nr:hypothetical protein [Puia sp.]